MTFDSSVAVDVGGTFTDCVAWTASGMSAVKVPTTADQADGVLDGASRLLAGGRAAALLHGSTTATNALLEKRGADTVLVTDAGFEDVIEIGRQDRPSLYDSFIDRAPPLVSRDDRFGFDGDVESVVDWLRRRRPESVAVSFAYSFADPHREDQIGSALADSGVPVSMSHLVAPEFREFERTSTTVLNAYLQPRVAGYLRRLARKAATLADRVRVMRSSGGLMEAEEAAVLASALLLSGPAGGVVAASEMGRARGYGRVITFDMGGTSTDVCRIESGRPEISYERTIDGYVCRMPSVAVHTVGAGGGSLAWVDPGGSLRVGPESAGARPGPAAYGLGGDQATVTDAHVVLGHIDSATRLGGALPLHLDAALAALDRLSEGLGMDRLALAEGVLEVVEAHMERAIRRVSVEQGADPRRATLVAFGGAGGLHAGTLAKRLGMAAVAIPPYAGMFSALGLLMAPPRIDGARSILLTTEEGFGHAVEEVASGVVAAYVEAHRDPPPEVNRVVDMRYLGQSHEIPVPLHRGDGLAAAAAGFHRLHAEINGFARPDDPVEVVTVRAVAEGRPLLTWDDVPQAGDGPRPLPRHRPLIIAGEEAKASVWWRPDLPAGMKFEGPAVVEEDGATTILQPGDRALVTEDGTVEVTWS